MKLVVLRDLLLDSRDGEWGKGEAGVERVKMRVIRGTDFPRVRQGDFADVPSRYLESRHADRKRLRLNDVLIETAGGTADRPTGRTMLVTERVLDALGSDLTCASFARFLRIDPKKAVPEFVFWLLQYHYVEGNLRQFHLQHTGVARFQFTTFADTFLLRLPGFELQRRIADILGAYDDLIEVNRRRIAVLEKMARRLFDEWFVWFRFPGHEGHSIVETTEGPLPKGWSRIRLDEVAAVNKDAIRPSNAPAEIGYVDISSVTRGEVHKVEWMAFADAPGRARRRVHDRSVIWSTVRPNRRSHALIFNPSHNLIVSTGFAVLDAQAVSASYLYHYTTTDEFVGYLVGNATGAAYPAVTGAVFERAKLVVPPRELDERFSNIAEPALRLIDTLHAQNARLAATRDLLLPRLISSEFTADTTEQELEAVA